MSIPVLITLISLGVSTVFGFGVQAANIRTMRRDINGVAKKYDDALIPVVYEMRERMIKIETLLAIEIQKKD